MGSDRPGVRGRACRPPRLLARDQHRRLLARRRRRLARAQARPADQRAHRGRDRHRRRRAPVGRRRQRARAVLGAARRRRQLRRRHGDRVRAGAAEDGSRRARCSSRSSAPTRSCTPIASGPRRAVPDEVTSVVPHAAAARRSPEIPEIVRGKSFAIVEAISPARRRRDRASCWRRCASSARRWTRSATSRRPRCSTSTWTRPSRCRTTAPTRCSASSPSGRSTRRWQPWAPAPDSPVFFEVRHLGGALSRSDASHGALDTMRGEYMMFGLGPIMDPAMVPADRGWPRRDRPRLRPGRLGRYLNFTEVPARRRGHVPATAPSPRLRDVKKSYDPEGLFRANHAV